jgi:hypothetical protein
MLNKNVLGRGGVVEIVTFVPAHLAYILRAIVINRKSYES